MACPGVAVFNTGDSLVALNIGVVAEDTCRGMQPMQFVASSGLCCATGDVTACDDQTHLSSESVVLLSPLLDRRADKEEAMLSCVTAVFREQQNRSGDAESGRNLPIDAAVEVSGDPLQQTVCDRDVGNVATKSEDCQDEPCVSVTDGDAGESSSEVSTTMKHCSVLLATSCKTATSDHDEDPSDVNELLTPAFMSSPPLLDGYTGLNVGSYPSVSTVSAVGNSCSLLSRPMLLQNDTQCLTYSVRHYLAGDMHHIANVEGN